MFRNSAKKLYGFNLKQISSVLILCEGNIVWIDEVNLIMCTARALIYWVARLNYIKMIILSDGRVIYIILNMIKRNVLSIAVDRVKCIAAICRDSFLCKKQPISHEPYCNRQCKMQILKRIIFRQNYFEQRNGLWNVAICSFNVVNLYALTIFSNICVEHVSRKNLGS